MEIWTGREKVEVLAKYVEDELERLSKEARQTYRVRRQISDGSKFLKMLKERPYSEVTKIRELKKLISQTRKKIQRIIADMEKFFPGYQLNVFESTPEIDIKDFEVLEREKDRLKGELKWLHKCLGICHNKEYFR